MNITPKQKDAHNCGPIWCLFVYDMMLQASVSYQHKLDPETNELPVKFGIGKTWLHPKNYEKVINDWRIDPGSNFTSKHLITMCQQFCAELVVVLERLRLMHLQNFSLICKG